MRRAPRRSLCRRANRQPLLRHQASERRAQSKIVRGRMPALSRSPRASRQRAPNHARSLKKPPRRKRRRQKPTARLKPGRQSLCEGRDRLRACKSLKGQSRCRALRKKNRGASPYVRSDPCRSRRIKGRRWIACIRRRLSRRRRAGRLRVGRLRVGVGLETVRRWHENLGAIKEQICSAAFGCL